MKAKIKLTIRLDNDKDDVHIAFEVEEGKSTMDDVDAALYHMIKSTKNILKKHNLYA